MPYTEQAVSMQMKILSILLLCLASGQAIASSDVEARANLGNRRTSLTEHTVCESDSRAMRAHSGVYLNTNFLKSVRKTRLWFNDQLPDKTFPWDIRIDKDGKAGVSISWHEAADLSVLDNPPQPANPEEHCLTFKGKELTVHAHTPYQGSDKYTYMGPMSSVSEYDDALYFDLIFNGCFRDQVGARWCFTRNAVQVGKVTRKASLALDSSEEPQPGSVLAVDGEMGLWVFRPAGKGWKVFKSTWVTDPDYVEPDWSKPWRVLTAE